MALLPLSKDSGGAWWSRALDRALCPMLRVHPSAQDSAGAAHALNKERTVKRSVEKQIAVIFGLALPILFVIGTFQYQSVLRLEDTHHQLALRSETLEELRAASALLNLADAASLGSATTAPQGALQAPGSADAARARLQKL